MDLVRLQHAVAVAREGSFTAAAQLIPLSQPALSRSIQSLEAEYGLRLFERGRAGAKLTPEGSRFISAAESLLHHADATDADLRLLASDAGSVVSFGMGPLSAASLLPRLLVELMTELPGARLRVMTGSGRGLRDAMRRGEIAFALTGVPQDSDNFRSSDGLTIERVGALHPPVLLVRDGHPLLTEPVTPEALHRYPVVASSFLRDLELPDLVALGLREPSVEMRDEGMLSAVVRATDAILVASRLLSLCRPDLELRELPLRFEAPRESSYVLMHATARPLTGIDREVASRLAAALAAIEAGAAADR